MPEAPLGCAPLIPGLVTSAAVTSVAHHELITIIFSCKEQKPKVRTGKIAQKIKVLVAKRDDLSSTPGIHELEGEN